LWQSTAGQQQPERLISSVGPHLDGIPHLSERLVSRKGWFGGWRLSVVETNWLRVCPMLAGAPMGLIDESS
jgi:hypothetical protein